MVADKNLLEAELSRFGAWFHNLHLPGGVETAPGHPLGDFPARKWERVSQCLPADLQGWRVLDVGCNAGYYSFALAARGAQVTAVDVDPRYLAQARWAARHMKVPIPPVFREMSVYRLHELDEAFDLVWFMGVAYHLRHPLLGLDIVRSLSPRYLMFQIMTFPDSENACIPPDFALTERSRIAAPGWPKLAFIEHRLAGDPTNWWAANEACAEAMLRSSGFEVLERPEHETYWCQRTGVSDSVVSEMETVLGRPHN